MKNYYNIRDTKLIYKLTKLFKSKKCKLDIKSIIYLFKNYFEKDNKNWNDKQSPNL